MKNIILIIGCILSISATAQNSYLVKKDGTKIIVDDNAVDVILIDKRISYKLPGKKWEKYVKYDDLDYLIYGSSQLKSFNLDNAKKSTVQYVLAEGSEKSLLSIVYSVSTRHGNMTTSNTYYKYTIIDNKSSVIVSGIFTASDREKNLEAISLAESRIKEHFSDCTELISRLENSGEGGVSAFLADPVYIKCN